MNESRIKLRMGALLLAMASLAVSGCVAATADEGDEESETDGPEPSAQGDEALSAGATVAEAVSQTCSTTSVKGLSRQIIEEGECMKPGSYEKLPSLANLHIGSAVFPYLEKPAHDAFVNALKAHPGKSMSINSMLRTIAQQYLLYTWYEEGRCGIGLAAHPGASNHETGLAFDTSDESSWRSILASHGFRWYGGADPVHFDYVGNGATNHKGLDVEAFQRLWNRNHPGDKISVDGDWGPETQARMRKSPAGGFKKGAFCN